LGRKRKNHCPTPTKPAYTNRHFAEKAIEDPRYRDPLEDELNTRPRCSAYPCCCGKWHLTSAGHSIGRGKLKKNR
jgi:hypothetical protein